MTVSHGYTHLILVGYTAISPGHHWFGDYETAKQLYDKWCEDGSQQSLALIDLANMDTLEDRVWDAEDKEPLP